MLDMINSFLPLLFGVGDLVRNAAVWFYDQVLGKTTMDTIFSIVAFKSDGSLDYSLYWTTINNLIGIVKPFGYALITTYFLASLLDSAAKDNVTMDSVIKIFIQLILVIAIVGNLELIINAFLTINESIVTRFGEVNKLDGKENGAMSGAAYVDAMIKRNQEGSHTDGMVGILFEGAILWIFHWISIIGITFAALSRALDIGWRCVLSPIGTANCFEGGISSPGVKYLKSLGASILAGAAIYAVAAIGMALSGAAMCGTNDNPDNAKTMIAVAALLATAGASIGINNKAKEIVG